MINVARELINVSSAGKERIEQNGRLDAVGIDVDDDLFIKLTQS